MNFEEAVNKYFADRNAKVISIEKLGSGLVADGYRVDYEINGVSSKVVCRRLHGEGMSRDYLSDNLGYLLLQHHIAETHPQHVKSENVVCFGEKIETFSLEGVQDVFQIVEFAEGDSYFKYISEIKDGFTAEQENLVTGITQYMKNAHDIKPEFKESKNANLYWRHSQDFIGSEVLMDILDVWPNDDLLSIERRSELIRNLYVIREETRHLSNRCAMIHSDLHPDNIRVSNGEVRVLDSARTIWGEPMDDLTSMLANYFFFGQKFPESKSEYKKAYDTMLATYFDGSIDSDSNKVARLYLPIRLLILAHPIFFSNDSKQLKKFIVNLALSISTDKNFTLNNLWK